jgi:hypothetical protein
MAAICCLAAEREPAGALSSIMQALSIPAFFNFNDDLLRPKTGYELPLSGQKTGKALTREG